MIDQYLLNFKEERLVRNAYHACPQKSRDDVASLIQGAFGRGGSMPNRPTERLVNALLRSASDVLEFFVAIDDQSTLVRKFWGSVYQVVQVSSIFLVSPPAPYLGLPEVKRILCLSELLLTILQKRFIESTDLPIHRAEERVILQFKRLAIEVKRTGDALLREGRAGMFNSATIDEFTKVLICAFSFLLILSSTSPRIQSRAEPYQSYARIFFHNAELLLHNTVHPRPVSETEAVLPVAVLTLILGQLLRTCPGRKQVVLKVYWDYFRQIVS